MATEEEIFKFVLQFENEEKLKSVTAAASLAEQKFRALYDQLGAGHVKTIAAANSLMGLNRQLATTSKSTRDWGRSTLEASRAIEDAQYGMAGVLNNIPSLVTALGGPAGLAGALSVAAVAAKVLYDHWDQLSGLVGKAPIRSQSEQMEELGKKTAKTADETLKLLNYERQRKNLAEQNQRPAAQQKIDDDINKAIREGVPQNPDPFAPLPPHDPRFPNPADKVRHAIDVMHGDRFRNAIPQEILDEKTAAQKESDDIEREIQIQPRLVSKARRDKVQARLDKVTGDYNTAYTDKRNAFQADLATGRDKNGNPAKLEKFIADAVGKGLLSSREAKALSSADPVVARKKAQEEAKNDRAQARYDQIEQARLDEEKDRREKAAQFVPGMNEKYGPGILGNIARGRGNDRDDLAGKIAGDLRSSGQSAEQATRLAPEIAKTLIGSIAGGVVGDRRVAGDVAERATREGISPKEAADRDLRDRAAAARARAPKPTGTMSDLAGFAQNLQMALFNKSDPIQVAILAENRKTADRLEKLYEETKKNRPKGALPAVAAGPA